MVSANNEKRAIVFVHGILGFSSLGIPGMKVYYFRALPPKLSDFSCPIYFPALPSTGRVEERAQALAHFLEGIDAERIDLIGHSMGGLDSRYVISRLDPHRRIRSLTTLSTPHCGSSLATVIQHSKTPIYVLLRLMCQPGLADLTPESCARFNEKIVDRPDVIYHSYACHRPLDEIPLIFQHWAKVLQRCDGDNDSQVPVSSSAWGKFQGTLRADHLELIGWSFAFPSRRKVRPFDHIAFFRNLVEELLQRTD